MNYELRRLAFWFTCVGIMLVTLAIADCNISELAGRSSKMTVNTA